MGLNLTNPPYRITFIIKLYFWIDLIMMQRLGEIKAFKDRNLHLRGADIATQWGWTGVPNFILESKEISIGAKLRYAMLLKYARELDNCFPGQDRLTKDMGRGIG
jgi:hypothetical protein